VVHLECKKTFLALPRTPLGELTVISQLVGLPPPQQPHPASSLALDPPPSSVFTILTLRLTTTQMEQFRPTSIGRHCCLTFVTTSVA